MFVISFTVLGGESVNVESIDLDPANYGQLDIIPSYGPVTENGMQYIKLVVAQNDGFGVMSIARLFVYDQKKKLQLVSQNYHYCSEVNNKCFIEFSTSSSELNNIVINLSYMNSKKSLFREYRIKGLGKLNPIK